MPVLKDPRAQIRGFAMSQYPRRGNLMGYAIRTERYRMVAWVPISVAETRDFKSADIECVELYDYAIDPLEKTNQAKNPEYRKLLKDLERKLSGFFRQPR